MSVPPDAKKESEITNRFDFGSAQVKSPRHPQQDYCAVIGGDYLVALVADGISSLVHAADASETAGKLFAAKIQKAVDSGQKVDAQTVKKITEDINENLLKETKKGRGELEESAEGQNYSLGEWAVSLETDRQTTFTGIIIQNGEVIVSHLGDSRLYHFRGGCLNQLTRDHTVAEERRLKGEPSVDRRDESVLVNYLGSKKASPDVSEYAAKSGDVWLLVSDGVSNVLTESKLKNILSQPKDAQSLANDLVEAVKDKGVADDTTAVVVRVK